MKAPMHVWVRLDDRNKPVEVHDADGADPATGNWALYARYSDLQEFDQKIEKLKQRIHDLEEGADVAAEIMRGENN